MANSEIREPKQKRSIEKKRRIIEAGSKMFYEKGYHNTNTAEIAKAAGVSTGIVYNYFNDKKGIFIEVVKNYTDSLVQPLFEEMYNINRDSDLVQLLAGFIDIFIRSHTLSKSAHEEMLAMSHSDEAVRELFCQFEVNTANTVVAIMNRIGLTPSNPHEKVHIAMGMIENLCHEVVYHQHEYMDYNVMKKEVIKVIVFMMDS